MILADLERINPNRERFDLLREKPKFASLYTPELVYEWRVIEERFRSCSRREAQNVRFIFVRHGTTFYNVRKIVSGAHNAQLTPEGIQQAEKLSEALSDVRPSLVFSSSLDRAYDTARIFLSSVARKSPEECANLSVVKDFRLSEVNLGVYQGKKRVHIDSFERGDIDFKPTDGESYREASKRVASFLSDVCAQSESSEDTTTVVAFCHAGIMRIIRSFFEDIEDTKQIFSYNFGNTGYFDVSSSEMRLPYFWKY